MYRQYSDLPQVVPNRDPPEPRYQQTADSQYPEHSTADKYNHLPNIVSASENATSGSSASPPSKPERRICGLTPRVFYVLLAVGVLIIIGAGVGGGVGGVLASHSSSNPKSSSSSGSATSFASSTSTITPTQTTSTNQAASITTTEIVGPTSTLYRDCPSSNDTLYSVSFGSDEYIYRKYCSISLVDDGTNVVNEATTDLDSYVSSSSPIFLICTHCHTCLNVPAAVSTFVLSITFRMPRKSPPGTPSHATLCAGATALPTMIFLGSVLAARRRTRQQEDSTSTVQRLSATQQGGSIKGS